MTIKYIKKEDIKKGYTKEIIILMFMKLNKDGISAPDVIHQFKILGYSMKSYHSFSVIYDNLINFCERGLSIISQTTKGSPPDKNIYIITNFGVHYLETKLRRIKEIRKGKWINKKPEQLVTYMGTFTDDISNKYATFLFIESLIKSYVYYKNMKEDIVVDINGEMYEIIASTYPFEYFGKKIKISEETIKEYHNKALNKHFKENKEFLYIDLEDFSYPISGKIEKFSLSKHFSGYLVINSLKFINYQSYITKLDRINITPYKKGKYQFIFFIERFGTKLEERPGKMYPEERIAF